MMLSVMLVVMYRQVSFRLDIYRCLLGITTMFAMVGVLDWMPKADGFIVAVEFLSVITCFSGFVIVALLWKNPATLRLIKVQLRKN